MVGVGNPWSLTACPEHYKCLLTYYPYRTCHPEMLFLLVFFGLPNVVRLGFTWASEVNTLSFDLPPETLQAFYCCYYHRKIPVWFRGYIYYYGILKNKPGTFGAWITFSYSTWGVSKESLRVWESCAATMQPGHYQNARLLECCTAPFNKNHTTMVFKTSDTSD